MFLSAGQWPIRLLVLFLEFGMKEPMYLISTQHFNLPHCWALAPLIYPSIFQKNAEDSIRTSPGSCEPRLRNDSQLPYDPHRRLLCFMPADFSFLDVSLILEGSLFVSSRE